jgi:hypothetical protein
VAVIRVVMSPLGHEQTSRHVHVTSVIPLKADISQREWHVRFVPQADIPPFAGVPRAACARLPRRVVQSAADNGVATASSGLRSAATPKRNAISAAASIRAAPKRYPPNRLIREPVSIRAPKNHGAPMPPIAVPTEKKKAIANARISSGKVSLTVR